MTYREPLDVYDMKPAEMVAYFRYNGSHFNTRLAEWAARQMRKENPSTGRLEGIEVMSKDKVDDMLAKHGVKLEHGMGADYVYVANAAMADFYRSSLPDEEAVAKYVKDVVDDPDQADGFILCRFMADCCRAGVGIPWADVL